MLASSLGLALVIVDLPRPDIFGILGYSSHVIRGCLRLVQSLASVY